MCQHITRRIAVENSPGTAFQSAVDRYVFDKKLPLLVLDALKRIEIAQRVDISHGLGKQHKFAYLQPELFHESFSSKLEGIWVACEVWDFGTLSTLFDGMSEADQDVTSTQHNISNGRIFASWLLSLNYLRNLCAHHSRLWNRNIVDLSELPPVAQVPSLAAFRNDPRRQAHPDTPA
ncbi:Abi family protein [Pseudomonas borbori]|uniref:Abi-like protein n=1 Tax=Pseudomonas borbori TaxID=289003 RepID=A0A1I5WFG3_9PSED|nr:Abi family protein [Pseudomonas borbori]SFQ18328.1 Abi-like protein [Pseudomonas borbori]